MYRILKSVIIAVWIGCTAWLIRFEAYPQWFEDTVQGYKELARELPAIRDSWLKVMVEDKHVGYAHSSTQIDEKDGEEVIVMSSQLYLRLLMPTGISDLRMRSEIRLDAREEFQASTLRFFLQDFVDGEINLNRVDARKNLVSIVGEVKVLQLPPFKIDRTFELPSEAIVSSPLLDFGLSQLKPGEELRIRTLDPFSFGGSTQTLVLRGEAQEVWPEGPEGTEIKVYKVSMNLDQYNLSMNAWIDEYGRVLRQETPFGVHLVYSTSSQAGQIPEESALELNTFLSSSPIPTLQALPFTP